MNQSLVLELSEQRQKQLEQQPAQHLSPELEPEFRQQ
jgi:hypothetical protein